MAGGHPALLFSLAGAFLVLASVALTSRAPTGITHEADEQVLLLSRSKDSCSVSAGRNQQHRSCLCPSLGIEPRVGTLHSYSLFRNRPCFSRKSVVHLSLCHLQKPNHQFSAGFKSLAAALTLPFLLSSTAEQQFVLAFF